MVEHDWVTITGQAPAKSNQYRIVSINGHSSLAKQHSLKKYEESFYWQLPGTYRNLMIECPFELHIRSYFTSMSNDIDNILKVVLDILQYTKTIKNDNRCCKIVAEKFIDKQNPRIEFKIVEV